METLKHEKQIQKIFTNVNEWLKFAEVKNVGLLTLNASIVFGFSQTTFVDNSVIKIAGYYAFLPFAILSFVTCLISLFPIVTQIEKKAEVKKEKISKKIIKHFGNWIDKEDEFENIHFFGYLKDLDESLFEEKLKLKTGIKDDFMPYEKELCTQILYNSRITWLKYEFFKIGAFFFLLGLILFSISLPIIKFLFSIDACSNFLKL